MKDVKNARSCNYLRNWSIYHLYSEQWRICEGKSAAQEV